MAAQGLERPPLPPGRGGAVRAETVAVGFDVEKDGVFRIRRDHCPIQMPQDRDGGVLLTALLFVFYPLLLRLYVYSGYTGPKFHQILIRTCLQVDVEVAKRSDAGGYVVPPKC